MYKLFSERMREESQGVSDVYEYKFFREAFRNQFLHILDDLFLGQYGESNICTPTGIVNFWKITCEKFAREKGLKWIYESYAHVNDRIALMSYVDSCSNADFLDLLDFVFTTIVSSWDTVNAIGDLAVNSAIDELNYRFKQHSLGYEFVNGHLIVKTNEQIHREIVKPALHLLHNELFQGAEQEYFCAFECFKQGNNKDAIVNAIKAYESVMKTICKERNYAYNKDKDTAKQLLQHLKNNKFFPSYLETHLVGICTTLESGASTFRNRNGAHGQQDVTEVSDTYVQYALNLVATNIVFLVKLFNEQGN